MLKDQVKKVPPLGVGIELCKNSSCLEGLRRLLNTEGILTLPMFLLSDGSLIWMWSASFAWWGYKVLLSLSIIVKSLSSAFAQVWWIIVQPKMSECKDQDTWENDSGSTICQGLCSDVTQRVWSPPHHGQVWGSLSSVLPHHQSKKDSSIIMVCSWIHCPFTFHFYWGVQHWREWKSLSTLESLFPAIVCLTKRSVPGFAKPIKPLDACIHECWISITSGKSTKFKVYKAVLLNSLLYAYETWTLYRKYLEMLWCFHMHSLRSILKSDGRTKSQAWRSLTKVRPQA